MAEGPLAMRAGDLLWSVPLVVAVCLIAAGFAWWAWRIFRAQTVRAEHLERDLVAVKEESRRRLNFLNAVSHDVRTPLNGIMLQTHVVEHAAKVQDENAIRQAVENIRGASALAAVILDSLLEYARTELTENTLQLCRVKELITATADPFRVACEEKGVQFTLTVPSELQVRTDCEKLRKILGNLLDNAVKFTRQGCVAVRARLQPRDGAGTLIIEVADTGSGICREHHEKLFREFFQANNPSRDARLGLGLGLVVARRLAEHLEGTLVCESEEGRGATFRLELPLGDDGASPQRSDCPATT